MRLDWPDCHNARDLGGLRTADGQTVRKGALIRSDQLDRLTDAGVDAVRAHGVSRIIDLRGASEISRHVHPFAVDEVYRHVPFIDEVADRRRDPVAEATLIGIYRASIHRNRVFIGTGVAAVIDAPPGGVLVHCAAGKDRTGVLIALLLRAVGVPAERVAEDYALTAELMATRFAEDLAAADEDDRATVAELQACRPEIMLDLLDHIDESYGGPVRYLAGIGVTPERLALLRARLLT
jgi:protein tyrosine/serine phosphatase